MHRWGCDALPRSEQAHALSKTERLLSIYCMGSKRYGIAFMAETIWQEALILGLLSHPVRTSLHYNAADEQHMQLILQH